jgi:hypothetical protein
MDDKMLAVELKLCGEWYDAPIDSPIFAAALRLTSLAEEVARLREALTVAGNGASSILELDLPEDHTARCYAAIALAAIDTALAPAARKDGG